MVMVVIAVLVFFPPQKSVDHRLDISYGVTDQQFRRALGHLLGPPLLEGNRVQAYQNGVEIFPAMIEAIQSAKKTITFEAFIYWSDHIGEKFIDALAERARAGVKVHVLVDWFGSRKMKSEHLQKMKEAGVQVEIFRPLSWWNLNQMNNRTHRRILVVDGHTGFMGGVGICDDWDGDADQATHWRDSQYKIVGPVVAFLQGAFLENWMKLEEQVHHDESYFPELKPEGQSGAQLFRSSPQSGSESVRLMYMLAIAAAKKRIIVASAYFVPDQISITEFIQARARGVQVQILVPGPHGDTQIVKSASKALWGELLKSGVEIYEYQPSRFHRKVMIVDEHFTSVGSTNFDNRSFRLNEEANLNILDSEFAQSETQVFERDLLKSKRVSLADWKNRPLWEKLTESLSSVIEDQL